MVQRLAARLLSTVLALLAVATPLRAELTNGRALAAVYDSILAGRFDEAERDLKAACPPAPVEACQAMAVAILWWRISLNPESQVLDERIERDAMAAIDAAERWTRREPANAEAWFYHAAAHAPLVQWRLLRDQRLTAIREASRVKSSLERTLDLDPTLQDAHFGIGLYRYYAGIAPTAFRMLRWLFWLPGGNRQEGLRQMEQARSNGQLLGGEADYQLHFIYLWYENQHARALELLENLHERYPTNPLFLERIAETQQEYFNDYPASVAAWTTLVRDAERNAMAVPRVAAVAGRLGLASALDGMYRSDRAIDVLQQLVETQPDDPPDALARAYLQLGAAHDRLGQRDRAVAAYRQAIREASESEAGEVIRELATEGTRRTPLRQSADAYRLSLDGLRALEAGDATRAVSDLAQSVALEPSDLIARYRYARALIAADQSSKAVALLESVANARPSPPPHVHGSALADLGALVEARGDVTHAISLYRRARDMRGATRDARDAAAVALTRLEK